MRIDIPCTVFQTVLCTFFIKLPHLFPSVTTFNIIEPQNETSPAPRKIATITSFLNFEKLSKCTTFIDKTLLIHEFIYNSGPGQFQLITCPPKFGKTLNLYMLKKFLLINRDNIHIPTSFFDSLFKISPKLKWESPFRSEHLSKYFIIHVSFKHLYGNTYEKILNGIRAVIKTTFETFEWLYRDFNKLVDRPKLMNYVHFMDKVYGGKIEEEYIATSLFQLSKMLCEHTYGKVLLLVDDYDLPIISAIEHNANVTGVTVLIQQLISQVLNSDHSYVNYAIITGVHNVLDKIKNGNVKHYDFLGNNYLNGYFGFTQEEVITLLDRHNVDATEKDQVINYYRGYNISNTNLTLYNPLSIVKYLQNQDAGSIPLGNYWSEITEEFNLMKFFKKIEIVRDILSELLTCKNIKFSLIKHFNYVDLNELRRLLHEDIIFTDYHADLFLSYLFNNGYLSYTGEPDTYAVPNQEIESYLKQIFVSEPKAPLSKWKHLKSSKCFFKSNLLGTLWSKLIGKS